MEEFIFEHWQLIASLGAALLNFLFALIVHKRSSGKIAKLKDTEAAVDDALFTVQDKLHALLSSIQEELNEKKDLKGQEQKALCQNPEEPRR